MRIATAVILALMVWVSPLVTAQAGVPETADAVVSKAAKKKNTLRKALKKCRAIKKKPRRQLCVRKARKRFAKKPTKPTPPKPGTLYRIDVLDTYETDYFSPDYLEIKSGDSIEWIWSDGNQNPHNVTPVELPVGVKRADYTTANSPSRNFRWVRRFEKTGTWRFHCSLHKLMTMTVKVGD